MKARTATRRGRDGVGLIEALLIVGAVVMALVPLAPPALATRSAGPRVAEPTGSTVAIDRESGGYCLLVDGIPRYLYGMGYNVQFSRLPGTERRQLLSRDFARMSEAGVTMVLGWDPAEFDQMLLDVAHEHGIGVILPFHLEPRADYSSIAVQADYRREILSWVERYRQHPALLMWGIGNEVMLTMSDAQARAFTSFLAEMVFMVRDLDPDHPVIYREAEDVTLGWVKAAMAPYGGPPPGFVYGMNFYTPRLAEVLDGWVDWEFDVPVVISEFSPAGVSSIDRPAGLRAMWGMLLARGDRVLGGAPYVWSTEGPEAVDRLFGLTDAAGRPVDGSIATLRAIYTGREPADESGRVPDVVGMREDAGQRAISEAGLQPTYPNYQGPSDVPDPSIFNFTRPGYILSQIPPPGSTPGPGATVYIAVAVRQGGPVAVGADRAIEQARAFVLDRLGQSPAVLESHLRRLRESYGADVLDGRSGDDYARRVDVLANLLAWTAYLSEIPSADGQLLFPGAKEALPVLRGMVRWSVEHDADVATAESFVAEVVEQGLARAAVPE